MQAQRLLADAAEAHRAAASDSAELLAQGQLWGEGAGESDKVAKSSAKRKQQRQRKMARDVAAAGVELGPEPQQVEEAVRDGTSESSQDGTLRVSLWAVLSHESKKTVVHWRYTDNLCLFTQESLAGLRDQDYAAIRAVRNTGRARHSTATRRVCGQLCLQRVSRGERSPWFC